MTDTQDTWIDTNDTWIDTKDTWIESKDTWTDTKYTQIKTSTKVLSYYKCLLIRITGLRIINVIFG